MSIDDHRDRTWRMSIDQTDTRDPRERPSDGDVEDWGDSRDAPMEGDAEDWGSSEYGTDEPTTKTLNGRW